MTHRMAGQDSEALSQTGPWELKLSGVFYLNKASSPACCDRWVRNLLIQQCTRPCPSDVHRVAHKFLGLLV